MVPFLKKHIFTSLLVLILFILAIIMPPMAVKALSISYSNLATMLGVIPPIFILIGLMDVWIPKETMIKYMGDHSGFVGLFFAFLLGSMAAGPLYAAFPIAGILLKKGARLAYVLFFLGTWTSAKIPLILFEVTSLGGKFTLVHVTSMLTLYLISAFAIEKSLNQKEKKAISDRAASMVA